MTTWSNTLSSREERHVEQRIRLSRCRSERKNVWRSGGVAKQREINNRAKCEDHTLFRRHCWKPWECKGGGGTGHDHLDQGQLRLGMSVCLCVCAALYGLYMKYQSAILDCCMQHLKCIGYTSEWSISTYIRGIIALIPTATCRKCIQNALWYCHVKNMLRV